MPGVEVFQQKREIVAGGAQALAQGDPTDLHQEATVTFDKDGLRAEASVFNIAHDTWKGVKVGDPFRVSMGYRNGPYSSCIVGLVTEKYPPERQDSDIKYSFKGKEAGAKPLEATFKSHTWNQPTLPQVARDIASFAGISTGVISIHAQAFQRRWSITKEHNLKHWLNVLKKEADERSGEQHEFYVESGKLYFKPKKQPTQSAITLQDGKAGTVIQIDESQGKDKQTNQSPKLEFDALLDPRVTRNSPVSVGTESYSGVYRLKEYELRTSTETGDHTLSGVLAPTGSQYEVLQGAPPHKNQGGGHVV